MSKLLQTLSFSALLLGLVSCKTSTTTLVEDNDIAATLRQYGWIVLPFPDSNYSPGTVIYFPKGAKAPSYIGKYASCNVPADKLAVQTGNSPSLDTNKNYSATLKVAATLAGVNGNLNLSAADKATVNVTSQGDDVIDLVALWVWQKGSEGKSKFSPDCQKWFTSGYYVINEGWSVKKGTMTFQKGPNASISVDPVAVSTQLKVGGSASISASSGGTLTFSSPSYVAIRGAMPLDSGVLFLGPGAQPPETADSRLQTWASGK